jgi:hypothetical protein
LIRNECELPISVSQSSLNNVQQARRATAAIQVVVHSRCGVEEVVLNDIQQVVECPNRVVQGFSAGGSEWCLSSLRSNPGRPARIIHSTSLALTQGTRLGPYEIVAPPRGGEVCNARDTRLDWTLAITISVVAAREHVR